MPFTQPRSLSNDQVYALTAYLLRDNFFPEFPKVIPQRP
jgi:hypothetical protein